MARIVSFDKMVRNGEYPNRLCFSTDYMISERTVARDIEYLRDRLEAPLEFNRKRKGYYYSRPWNLPTPVILSVTKEDLIDSILEQLKLLSDSDRDLVLKSAFQQQPISQIPTQPDSRPLLVA
jgi:proteasome accessory factor B